MIIQKYRESNSSRHMAGISLIFVLSAIAAYNPKFSLIAILGFYYVGLAYLNPDASFRFLIMLFPFVGTFYFSMNFGGVPGLKLMNFCIFITLCAFILSGRRPILKAREIIFLFGILILLITCVYKSLPFLEVISIHKNVKSGILGYINSEVFKPVLFLSICFIVVAYVRRIKDLKLIIASIRSSLALLSCSILFVYIFSVGQTGSFRVARDAINSVFGMHANNLVDFYILSYPLVLAAFLHRKTLLNAINVGLSIICVALLYSRAAYAVILFSTFAVPFFGKRKAWVPVFALIALIGVSMAPSSVVERGLTGIQGPTDIDIQKFSAGRVGTIWIPMIKSIKEDSFTSILFGRGQFSIAYATDISWGHAHNMYIETLSDLGLLGLLFFVVFYFFFLLKIYIQSQRIQDVDLKIIFQGIFISIISWLISGLAGRHFFPNPQNLYLWVLLGVGLALLKLNEAGYAEEENMLRSP